MNCNISNAQLGEKNFLYSSSVIQIGNYSGIGASMNYVLQQKYSLQIGFSACFRQPVSEPYDYYSGLIIMPPEIKTDV